MSDPYLMKAAALHVQGLREAKRIAAEEGADAEAAAFTGFMLGLELGLTLSASDLPWSRTAHDELAVFDAATSGSAQEAALERRRARRRTLLTQANAIIRATGEKG